MRCLLAFFQFFGNIKVLIDHSNEKLHKNDYEELLVTAVLARTQIS